MCATFGLVDFIILLVREGGGGSLQVVYAQIILEIGQVESIDFTPRQIPFGPPLRGIRGRSSVRGRVQGGFVGVVGEDVVGDVEGAEAHERVPARGIREPVPEDGEAHLAQVARPLLLAAAPEEALVVVRDDVVAEGDGVGAVLDVEEPVVPVHLPPPEERVGRHRAGRAIGEYVAV